jgi:hypothetical protein
MPLYEERLLSPLAIRYMQAEIRSTFRDGRDVEASAAEIEAHPGTGDYDLVLRAPFPAIEILRRRVRNRQGQEADCQEAGGESPCGPGEKESRDQWFTFDNRRLYCLQKAAAAHWPLRVAAVVQVLYADHPAQLWRKKYDTVSSGRAVHVTHLDSQAQPFSWHWRQEVASPPGTASEAAWSAVNADQGRSCVRDLQEQQGDDDPVARLIAAEALAQAAKELAAKEHAAKTATTATAEARRPPRTRASGHARRGAARRAPGVGTHAETQCVPDKKNEDVVHAPRRRPRTRASHGAPQTCGGQARTGKSDLGYSCCAVGAA